MLTPRNSGSAPWTRVQDVTFTNNIVRHVAGVANIAGFDDSDPTLRTERITFRNNLFEDVNHTAYGTNAKAMLVGDGAATLVFDRNTIIHTNSSVLYAYGASMPGVVYTNNLSQHHRYGIMGSGASTGKPTIAAYFPGGVVQCNVLAGGTASLYPTPNAFPTVAQWDSAFVDPAAGDYRIASGSAVAAAGCGGSVPGADFPVLNAAMGGPPWTEAPAIPISRRSPTPADPMRAAVGASFSADGTASRDPDGTVLDYLWSWGDEVLVRAADLPPSAIRGSEWVRSAASDAAGGAMLLNPDRGAAKRAAALAVARELRRAHGQRGGGRPVPPLAAQPRHQQRVRERLALSAVQRRRRCCRDAAGTDRHDLRPVADSRGPAGCRRGRMGMERRRL